MLLLPYHGCGPIDELKNDLSIKLLQDVEDTGEDMGWVLQMRWDGVPVCVSWHSNPGRRVLSGMHFQLLNLSPQWHPIHTLGCSGTPPPDPQGGLQEGFPMSPCILVVGLQLMHLAQPILTWGGQEIAWHFEQSEIRSHCSAWG